MNGPICVGLVVSNTARWLSSSVDGVMEYKLQERHSGEITPVEIKLSQEMML